LSIWYEAGLEKYSTNIKTDGVPFRKGCWMSKMRRYRPHDPSPSIAEPRQPLLLGAYSFVQVARLCPGVRRIALLGSLATAKAIPKDVDLLVTVERAIDLTELARAGRRLKGLAQTINLGADIFLADTAGHYLGRICHYRECHPRVACRAQHCGLRMHLNDDLHIVTLSKDQIASPPIELWPKIIRRLAVPDDLEEILLTKLEQDQ
jgi:predicted nucleotidyltransferase